MPAMIHWQRTLFTKVGQGPIDLGGNEDLFRTVWMSHFASQFSGKAPLVVKHFSLYRPWRIYLDRTNWKIGSRDVNILMLMVVTRWFRIPLIWTVLDKAGFSSAVGRIALMQRYLKLFDATSIRMLLADREFIGERWIEFLLGNTIPLAIRLKENLTVALNDGRILPLQTLLRKPVGAGVLKAWVDRFCSMEAGSSQPGRSVTRAEIHVTAAWNLLRRAKLPLRTLPRDPGMEQNPAGKRNNRAVWRVGLEACSRAAWLRERIKAAGRRLACRCHRDPGGRDGLDRGSCIVPDAPTSSCSAPALFRAAVAAASGAGGAACGLVETAPPDYYEFDGAFKGGPHG